MSIRLPTELLRRIEAVARARGLSINAQTILAIENEIRAADERADLGAQRGDVGPGTTRRA